MAKLDLRLDAERWRRLEVIVEERSLPVPEVVRNLIDDAYENVTRKRRINAVGRMFRLEVEDPPDAATLSRELEAAHEPGGVH